MVVAMKKNKPPKDEGRTRFALALDAHGVSVERASRLMGVKEDTIRAYRSGKRPIERASLGSVLRLCLETGISLDEILDRRDLWPENHDIDGLESAAALVEKRLAELSRMLGEIRDEQRDLGDRVTRLEGDGPPPQGRKRRA